MNAQDLDFLMDKFHKDKTVQLSDKLSIYQEKIIKNDTLYWKLCLRKEGEQQPKLLDRAETLYLGEDTFMHIPKLIDAYMEGQYLYVFVYKDYKAMLEIYYFKDGIKFEKTGYLLYTIGGGSVMNFGLYSYSVNIRKIGEFHYICFGAGRNVLDSGKFGLLRIKEDDVSEIKVKKDSERTIFYPYRRIKEIEGDVPEEEKKAILFTELKKLFKEHNLLAQNVFIYSVGYINYINDEWVYYVFYKTSDAQNEIKLVRYGNYLNDKRGFGWQFCDYTEEPLMPEYSKWKPKKNR